MTEQAPIRCRERAIEAACSALSWLNPSPIRPEAENVVNFIEGAVGSFDGWLPTLALTYLAELIEQGIPVDYGDRVCREPPTTGDLLAEIKLMLRGEERWIESGGNQAAPHAREANDGSA